MINNIPHLIRNNISISLALYATAIALLLLASPLVFSNLLLQPVQAQTLMSFRTVGQATGEDPATNVPVGLTFDANGTINNERIDITSGTIHLQANPGSNGKIYNGTITRGVFFNESGGVPNFQLSAVISGLDYTVSFDCNTSSNYQFSLESGQTTVTFTGPVECSKGGGNTTSSSMTGTTTTRQDSDGDGIPDSSDRCTHNSNPRCFKGGDTSTTEQSSNRTGNQTR